MNRAFLRSIVFSLLLHGALLAALLWWARQTPWLGSGGDLDQGRIPILMVRPGGGGEEGEVKSATPSHPVEKTFAKIPPTPLFQRGNDKSDSVGTNGNSVGGNGEGGNSRGDSGQHLLSLIEARLNSAKRYPPLARRNSVEGRVSVRFSITPDGAPATIEVAGSSGSSILDQEAIATVKRAAPLPYYPQAITVPIVFELR